MMSFQRGTRRNLNQKGMDLSCFEITTEWISKNVKDKDNFDFNTQKLYTSKGLIDYMRSQGKTLQIYRDDFKLWKNKRPK